MSTGDAMFLLTYKPLSVTEKRFMEAVGVMIRERPYVISRDGRFGGHWRDRYCDHLALGVLREELYGPEEEEFAGYYG